MCSDSAVIVRWIVRWTYGITVQKVDVAQWVDELAVLYTATPREEHNDRAPHSFIPGQKSASGTCAENTSNARGSRWSDLLSLSEPQFSIAYGDRPPHSLPRSFPRLIFSPLPLCGNPHLALA